MKTAVYAGSFDPVTLGHVDIAVRASKIFERVIVAVLNNSGKTPLFTVDERIRMLNKTFEGMPRIEVESYDGLLAEYVKNKGAAAVVRGIRNGLDFDNEIKMDMINKKLFPGHETVFFASKAENLHISSDTVKVVAAYGGDLSGLLPECIIDDVLAKFRR
jgi:pantetheine-phosphate adenylyltransferase